MNTQSLRIMPLLLILLLAGCNNDIFIDDLPPSSRGIDLNVGEEASFTFQAENLISVRIFLDKGVCDWTIYGLSGDKINEYTGRSGIYVYQIETSLPLVGRAVAVNADVELEFILNSDNSITLRALKNEQVEALTGELVLDYSYKTESVSFRVRSDAAPGVYQVMGLNYDKQSLSREFSHSESKPLTVNNHGDIPSHQSFSVEDRCRIRVMFVCPDLKKFTLAPEQVMPEVEIPTYVNDGSSAFVEGWFHGDTAPFSTEPVYIPPLDYPSTNGLSFKAVYPVEVPPMSAMQAVMTMDMIVMQADALLSIRNTATGRSYDLATTVGVIQPFNYTFKWQQIPLEK